MAKKERQNLSAARSWRSPAVPEGSARRRRRRWSARAAASRSATSTWRWPKRRPRASAEARSRCRSTSPTAAPSPPSSTRPSASSARVDVLINNAGIMPVTPLVEESDDSIKRQLDINVYGVIVGTQLAIERLRPRASGHIVNIASQAGKVALPGIATYSGDQARRRRPLRVGEGGAARQRRRDLLRDADGGQHRADGRSGAEADPPGRGRGRRRTRSSMPSKPLASTSSSRATTGR